MSTRKRPNNPSTPPSKSPKSSPATSTTLTKLPSTMRSPLLPTPLELLLLSLYPLTLTLGSLFATVSPYVMPPTNKSTYSPYHQSYQPASSAPSYFATKANVFNVYFVKIGWFWCSLALLLFTALAARGRSAIDVGFAHGSPNRERVLDQKTVRLSDLDDTSRRQERDERMRRLYQVCVRWAALTALWYTLTQAFLGPSIIDRLFRASGGACYTTALYTPNSDGASASAQAQPIPDATSYGDCRRRGGRFAGGLDVSGHVFLLVLGSGMLFLEGLPVVVPWVRGLTTGRVVRMGRHTMTLGGDGKGREEEAAKEDGEVDTPNHGYGTRAAARAKKVVEAQSQMKEKPVTTRLKEYALWLTSGVLVLSWWMLLMTAAFFHSWVEKGSALVVAGTGLWLVYGVPRGVEAVRGIVGMPGV